MKPNLTNIILDLANGKFRNMTEQEREEYLDAPANALIHVDGMMTTIVSVENEQIEVECYIEEPVCYKLTPEGWETA